MSSATLPVVGGRRRVGRDGLAELPLVISEETVPGEEVSVATQERQRKKGTYCLLGNGDTAMVHHPLVLTEHYLQ